MSKKNTKSGLKSIRGGKAGGGYGVANSNGHAEGGGKRDAADDDERFPNGNRVDAPQGPETAFGRNKVIDFGTARAQRNLDNRRVFERFFLQHMIDVYCELGGGTSRVPIEIVEVSETGCSFRISADKSKELPRDTTGAIEPLQIRFYFSRDSYLRIGLHVVNATRDIAGGGNSVRYGCRVDDSFASAEAYRQFVRFMEQFARHALRDAKQASGY